MCVYNVLSKKRCLEYNIIVLDNKAIIMIKACVFWGRAVSPTRKIIIDQLYFVVCTCTVIDCFNIGVMAFLLW